MRATKEKNRPLVQIENLCYVYENQPALRDVNLKVYPGDFLAIIGPNGGGKTTLVKLILGLLQPARGTVLVDGKPPGAVKSLVGYVPQYIDHNQSFPATALDVVCMGLFYPNKRSFFSRKKEKRKRALAALGQIGLAGYAERQISELSGGQRQRVLIARALVAEPELLIFDEPTASLDTRAQTEFFELMKKLNQDRTILVVCHDLLGISGYAKSVACVNRSLHYHSHISSSTELVEAFYSTITESPICAVEHLRQLPMLQKEIEHV